MTKIFFDQSVESFIQALEKPTIAKVLHVIDLLEKFGHQLGLPHSKKIGAGLFELRIQGRQEIRIFYTFQKGNIVMLYGFIKKSQLIPRREIKQAKRKLKGLDPPTLLTLFKATVGETRHCYSLFELISPNV